MSGLTLNEYQTLANRTLAAPGAQHWFRGPFRYEEGGQLVHISESFPHRVDLMHAVLGLSGEVGELIDPVKKAMFYGKPLDVENVKEEAGDLLWYIAGPLCRALNCSFEELAMRNAAKLKKRYPEKYTDAAAIHRADKFEPLAPVAKNYVEGSAPKSNPPAGFEKMRLRELNPEQRKQIQAKYLFGDFVDFGDGYVWSTAEQCWQICPECWEPLTA